jgi:hypothetical protein
MILLSTIARTVSIYAGYRVLKWLFRIYSPRSSNIEIADNFINSVSEIEFADKGLVFCARHPTSTQNQPQLKLAIVRNIQGCHQVVEKLRNDCENYHVLGLDIQYISSIFGGEVNMLQICSHTGINGVFYLKNLAYIPASLKNLLDNPSILKVAVTDYATVKKLMKDQGVNVNGYLDLRFLYDKLVGCKKGGTLKDLTRIFLNIEDQAENLEEICSATKVCSLNISFTISIIS